jgi:hypothetical protein
MLRLATPLLMSLALTACAGQTPVPTATQAGGVPTAAATAHDHLPLAVFYDLLQEDPGAMAALARIESAWDDAYASMLLDLIYFSTSPEMDAAMTALLGKASGLDPDDGYDQFYRWIWSTDPGTHPRYAEFRAELYGQIDPAFRDYFDDAPRTSIRLDEILWGGVNQDGIPPLDHPSMVTAATADYLDDEDLVFGVVLDGEARAYPKRILAWHELVRDRVGGREVTGVYCTLCGAMILYDSSVRGTQYVLGTSGFLYRSNKLMYDRATSSLWSTLTGGPVVGPLVGQRIELQTLPVVTSTWGEWRRRHPDTGVLSLDTGFERDYSEGAAYRDYFATDRLMFAVPELDRRLPNKAEVLALRIQGETLAIAADYLRRHPVHHDRLGGTDLVVLTDPGGANRVFESSGTRFARWDGGDTVLDRAGEVWRVTEQALETADGRRQERLPAHRVFWFGWYAQFPQTRLLK